MNQSLFFIQSDAFIGMDWHTFLIASIVLTLSPGPDIIYVLVQSMANGKKRGMAIALGLVSGIIIHTTLVAFGVAILIKQHEFLLILLKAFGTFYLIFLAYQVYKSNAKVDLNIDAKSSSTFFEAFRTGFIMNVLNPKVTLFFLAFLPSFLPKDSSSVVLDTYFLGMLFMLQAIIIFGVVSLLADQLALKLRHHPVFNVIMKWAQVIVFLCIAGLLWFT